MLKRAADSIKQLEETHGWSITSASSSPPSLTMTYKSQLQLFFHPNAFLTPSQPKKTCPNAPISLSYIARDRNEQPQELSTTLRFFLQLLRASLLALPQCTTGVVELLALVSHGWTTALKVAHAESQLAVEGVTDVRIVSDERLAMDSILLLPKVRTKVRVTFELLAAIREGIELCTTVEASAKLIYGEQYDEKKMTSLIAKAVGDSYGEWANLVRGLKDRLVAQGTRGMRK